MLSSRRLAMLCAVPVSALSAQNPGPSGPFREPPPSITASGRSEVKVTPDRATIRISVQTKASTAAAAASSNATKQNAVIAALRKIGIPNERLSTTDYTVEPNYRYEQNKEPTLVGYVVTNTIVADIQDTKQVGPVLDAALGAGANMISSLDFYASNTTDARKQAIADAVAKARSEADAAARAAGGTLGGVIDIDIGGDYAPPPRPMYAKTMASADMAAATPINPGQQTLTVVVSTRWQFIPSGGR
jgi:uncharacterized protein YggE